MTVFAKTVAERTKPGRKWSYLAPLCEDNADGS